MLQAPPAATDDPQLLVCAKPALAVIDVILSAKLPELLSVTTCGELVVPTACEANVRLVGDSCATAEMPVPRSETTCGPPSALSVILRFAEAVPGAVGAKVTVIVQLPPAGIVPQLLVCEYCELFKPVIVTLLTANVALPELVTTTFCGELELPTICEPKAMFWLESATFAA